MPVMKITRRGLFAASLGVAARAQTTPARPPNFVVLFADDLGYSDLSCYGNPVIRTPNLDRLAAEGMRFTSFYAAAAVCTPSRVGLLTGRYPTRAGQPNNTGPETVGGLPLSEILLPQVLKQRGYRTMAIGKWHLGYKPEAQLPKQRGFDGYFGLPYSNDMIPPWVKTDVPLHLYRDNEVMERVGEQSQLTPRYTDEAVKFIRQAKASPFFLYLPYAMPHLPVSAPAARAGKSRAGIYGDTIETLDWSVGEIIKALREEGLERNTLVVFASDNGPWHNLPPRMLAQGVEPWHTGTKGMLRGAKGTTYEGGFRVPGIFRWPGMIPAGQTSADMASTLDLFPTFVKAAGGELPAGRLYDGVDLLPALRASGETGRRDFAYLHGKILEGLREGPWKYRRAGEEELFHLDWDPAEMYNLAERYPEVLAKMKAKFAVVAREIGATIA
jgi:arylsulfatase A